MGTGSTSELRLLVEGEQCLTRDGAMREGGDGYKDTERR